jgi:heparan-alpha-glucosaminide N-acetyltransferase
LLGLMAYLYKGGDPNNPVWMRPEWWGILGIIGWAYLSCALVYLLVKGNLYFLFIALAALLTLNIGLNTGAFDFNLWVIGDASSASLVMIGTITGVIYQKLSAQNKFSRLWMIMVSAGGLLILAGFLIRPYAAGISKIRATPAWVFICAGISMLVFVLIIWLVDINRRAQWFRIIRPAGTSTLTCYLLPYILYAIFTLTHFSYPAFLNEGAGGIIRSFAIGFFVIAIVGLMERRRIRLKV